MEPLAYAELTPEILLNAVEAVGIAVDGSLTALNSYENRVYLIGVADAAPVVVKFYRPGRWNDAQIQEEHDYLHELVEDEYPVLAPMQLGGASLHGAGTHRFAVFPRRGGRAPELEHIDTLVRLGRCIARMHGVGRRSPFSQRPALSPSEVGAAALLTLTQTPWLPEAQREGWLTAARAALQATEALWGACGPLPSLRLHGDCHMGNILWTDSGPHFLDFDDSCMGPAIQDLWMLLSGSPEAQRRHRDALWRGYDDFGDLPEKSWRLVEGLRALRLLRHNAWLAQRWNDPAFPKAFPWFAEPDYWAQQQALLVDQTEALRSAVGE